MNKKKKPLKEEEPVVEENPSENTNPVDSLPEGVHLVPEGNLVDAMSAIGGIGPIVNALTSQPNEGQEAPQEEEQNVPVAPPPPEEIPNGSCGEPVQGTKTLTLHEILQKYAKMQKSKKKLMKMDDAERVEFLAEYGIAADNVIRALRLVISQSKEDLTRQVEKINGFYNIVK
jgi:hypothetical protein